MQLLLALPLWRRASQNLLSCQGLKSVDIASQSLQLSLHICCFWHFFQRISKVFRWGSNPWPQIHINVGVFFDLKKLENNSHRTLRAVVNNSSSSRGGDVRLSDAGSIFIQQPRQSLWTVRVSETESIKGPLAVIELHRPQCLVTGLINQPALDTGYSTHTVAMLERSCVSLQKVSPIIQMKALFKTCQVSCHVFWDLLVWKHNL